MKLLVTGGAGFIGSNFIRYILTNYPEDEVLNFDKLTYAGNLDNLRDLENNQAYKFYQGDICDGKAVEEALDLMGEVDAIVNFAAETHVDRSILSAGDFISTDVYGTYILLETIKKKRIKRYVHISTDEVYGSIQNGSFSETSPLEPNSPYASSKAGGDLLVRSYFNTHDLPVIITRSSNNYGPYQYPEKLIPLFVTNAIEDQTLPLYGDGKNVRDWLHVIDNSKAIDLVLRRGNIGEIYNIGGGNERENIEIVKMILSNLGKSEELIKYVKDRPGHDARYSVNCEKIKALGWQPEVSLEDGLRETVSWYEGNPSWWKKIKEKQQDYKSFQKDWYEEKLSVANQ